MGLLALNCLQISTAHFEYILRTFDTLIQIIPPSSSANPQDFLKLIGNLNSKILSRSIFFYFKLETSDVEIHIQFRSDTNPIYLIRSILSKSSFFLARDFIFWK